MRIDGQFGFGLYSGADKGRPAEEKRGPQGASKGEARNASAPVSGKEQDYIAQALQEDDVDVAAVNEAIKLLQNGELDTPEAARRAAEAILFRGP